MRRGVSPPEADDAFDFELSDPPPLRARPARASRAARRSPQGARDSLAGWLAAEPSSATLHAYGTAGLRAGRQAAAQPGSAESSLPLVAALSQGRAREQWLSGGDDRHGGGGGGSDSDRLPSDSDGGGASAYVRSRMAVPLSPSFAAAAVAYSQASDGQPSSANPSQAAALSQSLLHPATVRPALPLPAAPGGAGAALMAAHAVAGTGSALCLHPPQLFDAAGAPNADRALAPEPASDDLPLPAPDSHWLYALEAVFAELWREWRALAAAAERRGSAATEELSAAAEALRAVQLVSAIMRGQADAAAGAQAPAPASARMGRVLLRTTAHVAAAVQQRCPALVAGARDSLYVPELLRRLRELALPWLARAAVVLLQCDARSAHAREAAAAWAGVLACTAHWSVCAQAPAPAFATLWRVLMVAACAAPAEELEPAASAAASSATGAGRQLSATASAAVVLMRACRARGLSPWSLLRDAMTAAVEMCPDAAGAAPDAERVHAYLAGGVPAEAGAAETAAVEVRPDAAGAGQGARSADAPSWLRLAQWATLRAAACAALPDAADAGAAWRVALELQRLGPLRPHGAADARREVCCRRCTGQHQRA